MTIEKVGEGHRYINFDKFIHDNGKKKVLRHCY